MNRRPRAVLLDVGGVFHLPNRSTISAAMSRAGYEITDAAAIDRAHYTAIGVFTLDSGPDVDSAPVWERYITEYARTLGATADDLSDVVQHLAAEFATVALWEDTIEGSREGLEELKATGVVVGIVSNADGSVEARLRDQGVLQVGPGAGIEVACVIDSGAVGVSKPDPRIFRIALEAIDVEARDTWYVGDTPGIDVVGARAAGIHPLLMDPCQLHGDLDVDTVQSLSDVARLVRETDSV